MAFKIGDKVLIHSNENFEGTVISGAFSLLDPKFGPRGDCYAVEMSQGGWLGTPAMGEPANRLYVSTIVAHADSMKKLT